MDSYLSEEQVRTALLGLLRPKSKWVEKNYGVVCDNCNHQALLNPLGKQVKSDFCPACGADMGGDSNG